MIISIICVATISILTTGCLTTTQKSTAVGTGGGAGDVGGTSGKRVDGIATYLPGLRRKVAATSP